MLPQDRQPRELTEWFWKPYQFSLRQMFPCAIFSHVELTLGPVAGKKEQGRGHFGGRRGKEFRPRRSPPPPTKEKQRGE